MIFTKVTVEAAAPVVCRPVSSWTGPPPPLVEAELRAAHAIASAARGEFVPQFSQALWQATAHVVNCAQIKFRGAFLLDRVAVPDPTHYLIYRSTPRPRTPPAPPFSAP